MFEFEVISSDLSQWLVRGGVPYSVEIYRLQGDACWTVQIVEGLTRKTVWENQLRNDALALIEAAAVIEVFATSGPAATLLAQPLDD